MITRMLFENLWMLAVTWVVVQFILIANWSWRRTKLTARIVWTGFAVLPLLILTSSLVVTDREAIITICEEMADAVEAGDIPAIARHLHENCEADDLDRDAFLDRVEQTLTRYRLWDVYLRRFNVTFSTDEVATVEFSSSARVRAADIPYEYFIARWRLTFHGHADSWLVTRIEPLPNTQTGLPNLRDLLR
ncbi:MAG: hypothetical protein JSU63_16785 [Phycisphaerales bacterium]|nr:MAG: hypothetical protein JSU63_16785 [Phycisphaerales bacterium]